MDQVLAVRFYSGYHTWKILIPMLWAAAPAASSCVCLGQLDCLDCLSASVMDITLGLSVCWCVWFDTLISLLQLHNNVHNKGVINNN